MQNYVYNSIAYSTSLELLAAQDTNKIRVWSANNKLVKIISGVSDDCPIVIDGTRLYYSNGINVVAWELFTQKPAWASRKKNIALITHVVVSKKKVYMSCAYGFVYVLDKKTGKELCRAQSHGHYINKIAVNDSFVVSGSDDNTACVLYTNTGRFQYLYGHRNRINTVCLVDSKVFTGSFDHDARIWDAETGECLRILKGHEHSVVCIVASQTRVATNSLDCTTRVWDSKTGECLSTIGFSLYTGRLLLYRSVLFISSYENTVFCVNINTGVLLDKKKTANECLCMQGSILVTINHEKGVVVEEYLEANRVKLRGLAKVVCLDLLRELSTFLFF